MTLMQPACCHPSSSSAAALDPHSLPGEAEEEAGRLCLRAASQPPTPAKLPSPEEQCRFGHVTAPRHETGLKIINGAK